MAADRLKREQGRIAAIENAASVGKGPVRKPLKTLQGRKLSALPDKVKPAAPTVDGRHQVGDYVDAYSHRRWKRIRDRQLSLEPLCRMCKAEGRVTPASVADHIVPHRGDVTSFWTGALQSLCATHHSSTKQRQERAGEA